MNRGLLFQVLDGAASPAMMLAVAVSQIKVGHQRRSTLVQDMRLAAELHERVDQKGKEMPEHCSD